MGLSADRIMCNHIKFIILCYCNANGDSKTSYKVGIEIVISLTINDYKFDIFNYLRKEIDL